MNQLLKLEKIELVGDELALRWLDGKESYLALKALRDSCPCAYCQGEADAWGRKERVEKKTPLKEMAYQLQSWEAVGGYGLKLFWKDGHNQGIFSYSSLYYG